MVSRRAAEVGHGLPALLSIATTSRTSRHVGDGPLTDISSVWKSGLYFVA